MIVRCPLLFFYLDLSFLGWREGSSIPAAPGEGLAPTQPPRPGSRCLMGPAIAVPLTPDVRVAISLRTAETTLSLVFSEFADTTVWGVEEERKEGQESVTTSPSIKGVTDTNYPSQTSSRPSGADLFSLWINAEWPTFLHSIYYLCCCFIDFEAVLLHRNGKI